MRLAGVIHFKMKILCCQHKAPISIAERKTNSVFQIPAISKVDKMVL